MAFIIFTVKLTEYRVLVNSQMYRPVKHVQQYWYQVCVCVQYTEYKNLQLVLCAPSHFDDEKFKLLFNYGDIHMHRPIVNVIVCLQGWKFVIITFCTLQGGVTKNFPSSFSSRSSD